MLQGPVRLAILAAALAFGAIGATLALVGLGVPFLAAAGLAATAAGLVQYAALRAQPPARDDGLAQQIEEFREATAGMRHDLRGILSPALMLSDRLLQHQDPAVQRAGQAVVRMIDRATAVLGSNKDALGKDALGKDAVGGTTPPAP